MRIPPFLYVVYMWFNGQQLSSNSLDRGLQFGDGHFTTLVIRHKRMEFWPRHWQRLQDASARLGMATPPQNELLHVLQEIAAAHSHCVVKIMITRGNSQRGYAPDPQAAINWYVTVNPLAAWSVAGVQVECANLQLAQQPALAGLKTLNRLEQVLLSQERQQRQVDDLIVCDASGYVVEAVSSNVFWFDGQKWRTPRLQRAGVDGILKQEICAHVLPSTVASSAVFAEFAAAEQAFLCNTVLGPRPITHINQRPLAKTVLPEVVYTWYSNVLSKSSAP